MSQTARREKAKDSLLIPLVDGSFAAGTLKERREAVLWEEKEREAERRKQLASQSSPSLTPDQRIRLWERLHGLRLPQSSHHKLVEVIASHTGLSSAEIEAEQQRRLQPRSGT
jgi:hypothetical protein